jgi:hypothetical protein
MICVLCLHRRARLVPLPLTGRVVALCDRCRGTAFIREMRKLVAHGAMP